ncbi:MAG: DNA mismatch repair endonuclease MutL [Candidatus Heimdallarchaeota archaeon]
MDKLKIIKLDKHVIEQIAAGEVVQRPASIVKELIENAIDAETTKIEIKIKQGGKQQIEVSDNGHGMSKDDAILAFERYSTSKIRTVKDLARIKTLGFRGEALASIASVSKVTMITRSKTSELGTIVVIEGGELKSVEPIGCSVGTTLTVNALFYNVPARRKFLKDDRREQAHIYDIVARYSLIHPEIAFQLDSEKRNLIMSAAATEPLDKILHIYGKDIARNLIRIDCSNPIKVEGFLSKPKISHRTRERLHIYVSSRLVKNKVIEDTVIAAYQRSQLLPKDRYPICVLNIEIAPERIDVNIHPTKREIRFHDERDLRKDLLEVIKDALRAADLLPEILPEKIHYAVLGEMGSVPLKVPSSREASVKPTVQTQISPKVPEAFEKSAVQISDIKDLKARELPWIPLGIIKNSFIVAYDDESVYFIDQHAAFERILFDELTEQIRRSTIKSQELLEPATVTLRPPRARVLEDNLNVLSEFGFKIEKFGSDTFLIRAVPVIYGYIIQKEVLTFLIEELLEKGGFSSLPSEKEIIQSIACHSVVRAGDPLTPRQIIKLLKRLYRTKDLFTCPHGRPITIQLKIKDLEKLFQRT